MAGVVQRVNLALQCSPTRGGVARQFLSQNLARGTFPSELSEQGTGLELAHNSKIRVRQQAFGTNSAHGYRCAPPIHMQIMKGPLGECYVLIATNTLSGPLDLKTQ